MYNGFGSQQNPLIIFDSLIEHGKDEQVTAQKKELEQSTTGKKDYSNGYFNDSCFQCFMDSLCHCLYA